MTTIQWRARLKFRGKLASPDDIFDWSLYRRVPDKDAAPLVRRLNRSAEKESLTPYRAAGAHSFEYRVKP